MYKRQWDWNLEGRESKNVIKTTDNMAPVSCWMLLSIVRAQEQGKNYFKFIKLAVYVRVIL